MKPVIPNLLTFSRFACVPLLLIVWYAVPDITWLPLVLMVYACVTDFFDGYLARRWKAQSELGRMLDPNADKLLIATALALLTANGLAHPAAVALILCRELFISALREFMADRNVTVHVTQLAKWKTTVQMTAILILLAVPVLPEWPLAVIGDRMLWLATALTLITGWNYWTGAKRHFQS
tara:strand:- start:396 stop:935 length:540 start_codon:yes stop_codon:yes gene_type:complete